MSVPRYSLYPYSYDPQGSKFHIRTVADFQAEFGTDHHPHRHPDLAQITFITAGTGTHTINGEDFALSAGSIFILPRNTIHGCHSSESLTGYILHFWRQVPISTVEYLILPEGSVNKLETHFEEILDEYRQTGHGNGPIIYHNLQLIFLLLDRLRPLPRPAVRSLAAEFNRLVDQFYRQHHRLSFYAGRLGTTPGHLNRVVSGAFGKTASEVLRDRLIGEARGLLHQGHLPVKAVAYHLGFSSPAYFSTFFRRYTGLNPKEVGRKA